MPNLIYMGNFSGLNVDPTEMNWNAENGSLLNGVSANYTQLRIVSVSAQDVNSDGVICDDDFNGGENATYNVGTGSRTTQTDAELCPKVGDGLGQAAT